ncbi:hypothetical protein [Streptomyces spongiae]|uniref:Spore-associated protein A n=1 Tax=Streptomyces spongiae TaxID=565072 RepID=A0A5N8XQ26_9ACTN|nr:hypothetical protein [Streptomyces spongiae]MPY61469.1 hypothetical protein [Streptomyces spongiae]
MHFRRRAVVLLATLATLIGANLIASTPAQAATSCSGTVTHSQTFRGSDGSIIGELTIYYNSSNGGTNSACFYHRGASYGVAANTYVLIMRCSQRSGEGRTCTSTAQSSPQDGDFSYYAGPVGVTGTANYCVAAIGWITWRGVNYGKFDPLTRGC